VAVLGQDENALIEHRGVHVRQLHVYVLHQGLAHLEGDGSLQTEDGVPGHPGGLRLPLAGSQGGMARIDSVSGHPGEELFDYSGRGSRANSQGHLGLPGVSIKLLRTPFVSGNFDVV